MYTFYIFLVIERFFILYYYYCYYINNINVCILKNICDWSLFSVTKGFYKYVQTYILHVHNTVERNKFSLNSSFTIF